MSKGRVPKKTLSKKTQSLLQQLERRRGVRALAERFLIVCEDDKSAPNYFEALKRFLGLSAVSVEVVGSEGHSQPIQVVKRAIERKLVAAQRNSGTEPFKHVWCVIDGDYGPAISNARSSAQAKGIKLAISTPCFEYWVLLHFEDTASAFQNCDSVITCLKRHIQGYEKGRCAFDSVVKNMQLACKRAQRIRENGKVSHPLPEKQNPSTEVYLLVNAVKAGCSSAT
jgi:hypothetical protein